MPKSLIESGFSLWRRERDSNPRYPVGGTHDFQSCALDQLSHLSVSIVRPETGAAYLIGGIALRKTRFSILLEKPKEVNNGVEFSLYEGI